MIERIKRDIIDNGAGDTMGAILCTEIPNAPRMDVSTGYFDVGGYGVLRNAIQEAVIKPDFRLRLMLGKDAIMPREDSFETYAVKYKQTGMDDSLSVKSSLDATDITLDSMADTISLINLLQHDNVEVRIGKSRFNHAKCYMFGSNSAFIGSSNFTKGGLEGNQELNAGIYQNLPIQAVQSWFERMWKDAQDEKKNLISILQQSKFGTPPEPYDVYIKMLFEKYAPLLKQDEDIHDKRGKPSTLAAFQRDAIRTSLHVINNYGGVIIADSTGLGKTNMGIEIIRQKILGEGKKVMLVAPAQVLHSMWDAKLTDVDIAVKYTVSMQEMGREKFLDNISSYRNIDFVVIDESQNFRSKNAQRRLNLMRLLSTGKRKQILLLTATPINNSLMDLYYQISIITGGKDEYFWNTVGIVDLYKHMRDATNKDLQNGLETIQQLLDQIMIRRTRSFIQQVYPTDTISGSKIRFPKHEYKPITYDISRLFGDIFSKMFKEVSSLTMAPYGLQQYNTSLSDEERNKHKVLAHLQVILLLKRFESSIEAVKISLSNKIRMYEHVERVLGQGKILRVRDFNKALAKWNRDEIEDELEGEDEREQDFVREVENVATEDLGSEYDTAAVMRDMQYDLNILRKVKDEVDSVTMDKKFDAVYETILLEKPLEIESHKVLIFTEYTATAKYIHKKLVERFPKKTVLLIHGDTKKELRQRLIKRFAPRANTSEDDTLPEDEADILVSTEVLSEGQNLQDCNYVINYDLPWNPMRIVQRTGRIDRLTSRFNTVHSRACFPDRQLDDILRLVVKIMGKIDTVDTTVGLDAELLGKMPNPKQYNGRLSHDIRTLAGLEDGSESVMERLTSEADVMPKSTPINEILRHVKSIGFDNMKSVPLGRRSGKSGKGHKAVLAYSQKSTGRIYFVIYEYEKNRAYVPDNDMDAIKIISCAKDTPKHLPMDTDDDHTASFEELLRIDRISRTAIKNRNTDGKKQVADLTRQRRQGDKNITKLENILVDALTSGKIDEKTADDAHKSLTSDGMKMWPDKIKEFISAYETTGDVGALASLIIDFTKGNYINVEPDLKVPVEEGAEELKLIGAMFVMDEFDPNIGRSGLDKF